MLFHAVFFYLLFLLCPLFRAFRLILINSLHVSTSWGSFWLILFNFSAVIMALRFLVEVFIGWSSAVITTFPYISSGFCEQFPAKMNEFRFLGSVFWCDFSAIISVLCLSSREYQIFQVHVTYILTAVIQ